MIKWWLSLLLLWCSPLAAQVPYLTSISANSGPYSGGTAVTLVGTGFNSPNVYFGSYLAPVATWSTTSISVTSPAVSSGGIYPVYVNQSFYSSNSINFNYSKPTATFTNTPTITATYTPTATCTNTATTTTTVTCTNTATKSATNTATQTSTNTATQTATNSATTTPTNTATRTPLPNAIVNITLLQGSVTPTPVTTPVPGYIDDLLITVVNNSGTSAGDLKIWLGTKQMVTLLLLGQSIPVGGFILRGDGSSNWAVSNPGQSGVTFSFNASVLLRGVATPVPVY